MFLVIWDTLAFDQMHALILYHPDRRAELANALGVLTRELTAGADTWGESRDPGVRLGYVGNLSALVRVDEDDRTVEIAEVGLRPTDRGLTG